MVLEAALKVIEPRPAVRTIDWAMANGWTDDGKPYNDFAYPHLSAPGGPFDAFDCDRYFDIWLQWASRLGKTFGGQIAMMKQADCDPCPMMFAASDEKLATEITERSYSMIERCPPLSALLPPPNRRRQSRISLRFSRVYVAWARSVSTLADKSARFIHSAEIDKWEHQKTSGEADPLKLADDRAKDFPTYKRWKESTPARKATSRIERGRISSCNASFHVPCPLCGKYQILSKDRLRWDKNEAGRSDKDIARNTARYYCVACEGELRDEHRGSMMRGGVWIPEGCGCDDEAARAIVATWREPGRSKWEGWTNAPWITGTPARDGRDYGSVLTSLYALSRSWGDIAAEWVHSQKNAQELRNFINQWLAETWDNVKRRAAWEEVAERLIDKEIKQGVVPKWASIVTIGVDRQLTENKHPWVVDVWGPERRSATIANGDCDSIEAIERDVCSKVWPHEDGGEGVKPSMVLIDSGHRPIGVYECCDRLQAKGIPALPCKGSSTALNSDYEIKLLGKNTSRPGGELCMVDTIRSQLWIDKAIYDADPKSDGGFAIYNASQWEHEDFIHELMNDAAVEKEDSHNNATESWDRINTNIPNDKRDCKRYSRTAMLIATGNGPIPKRQFRPPHPLPVQQPSRIRELRIRR